MATKKPMKRIKRFANEGYVTSDDSNFGMKEARDAYDAEQAEIEANKIREMRIAIDDESRQRDAENEGARISEGERMGQMLSSSGQMAAPSKPRIVSKAELEKSGLSLRDFLNKERGLTRRTPAAAPAAAVRPTPAAPVAKPVAPAAPAAAAATPTVTTREERLARIDEAFKPPSAENIQKGLEASTLGAGLGLKTIAGLAKNLANRKSALKDRLRLNRPGTVSGEGFVMRDGKMVKDIAPKAPQKALPSTITDVVAKKRGGAVKKMAHGGSVKTSTASSRGDGIALRGKTRGKIY